jgi:hypothetical protein
MYQALPRQDRSYQGCSKSGNGERGKAPVNSAGKGGNGFDAVMLPHAGGSRAESPELATRRMSATLPSLVMANSIASLPFLIDADSGIKRYQFSFTSSRRERHGPQRHPPCDHVWTGWSSTARMRIGAGFRIGTGAELTTRPSLSHPRLFRAASETTRNIEQT